MSSVTDELIRLNAEVEVATKLRAKAEQKLIELHNYQVGQPAIVNNEPYTLKYLWVRYEEGIPKIVERFETNPVWDGEDFVTKTPNFWQNTKVEYLKELSEDERERLYELNGLAETEYRNIDSKAKAQELEEEREKLFNRCGHKFKDHSSFMSSYQRVICEKCDWEISNA